MLEQTENVVKKAGRPKVKRPVYKDKDKYNSSVSGMVSKEIIKKLNDDAYLRSHRCESRSEFVRTAIIEKDERLNLSAEFEVIKSDLNRHLFDIKNDLMERLIHVELANEAIKVAAGDLINVVNSLSHEVNKTANNQTEVDKKLMVIMKLMIPIADHIREGTVNNETENHG